MNNINFANTSTTKLRKATQRATIISVIIFVTAVIAILFLQIKQWHTLKAIKGERDLCAQRVATLEASLKEKRELLEQKELLETKIQKIQQIQNTPQIPFALFSSINKALGATASLESLTITKKRLDITITCPTIAKATHVMHHITELPWVASLDLSSITPDGQSLRFKMTGKLS